MSGVGRGCGGVRRFVAAVGRSITRSYPMGVRPSPDVRRRGTAADGQPFLLWDRRHRHAWEQAPCGTGAPAMHGIRPRVGPAPSPCMGSDPVWDRRPRRSRRGGRAIAGLMSRRPEPPVVARARDSDGSDSPAVPSEGSGWWTVCADVAVGGPRGVLSRPCDASSRTPPEARRSRGARRGGRALARLRGGRGPNRLLICAPHHDTQSDAATPRRMGLSSTTRHNPSRTGERAVRS